MRISKRVYNGERRRTVFSNRVALNSTGELQPANVELPHYDWFYSPYIISYTDGLTEYERPRGVELITELDATGAPVRTRRK